jgi:hypothetical protein
MTCLFWSPYNVLANAKTKAPIGNRWWAWVGAGGYVGVEPGADPVGDNGGHVGVEPGADPVGDNGGHVGVEPGADPIRR